MANFRNYENALLYGTKITNNDIDGSLTTNNIANATIKGSNVAAATLSGALSTLTANYITIAAATNGATAVNVFGSATAPVAGTITGFYASNATASAGSIALWGTTAGTIAQMNLAAGIGTLQGTNVLTASVVAGDSVYLKATAGTHTGFVVFQTTA